MVAPPAALAAGGRSALSTQHVAPGPRVQLGPCTWIHPAQHAPGSSSSSSSSCGARRARQRLRLRSTPSGSAGNELAQPQQAQQDPASSARNGTTATPAAAAASSDAAESVGGNSAQQPHQQQQRQSPQQQPPQQQQQLQQQQPQEHGGAAEEPDSGAAASANKKTRAAAKLANRVGFGVLLGLAGAGIIAAGTLPFLGGILFIAYQATQEYYGFITSKGMTEGMTPPPPLVSSATTVLCVSMAVLAYVDAGRSGTVLALASMVLLVMEVVIIKKPKFSQMASSLFGLFYCGWLPSFWVKLRMLPMAAPPTPAFLGFAANLTPWTVGLVATFTAVACVIAADTGAYFVGKNLGRTKFTEISPKKTVEGALGGLVSSASVALGLWKVTSWPATPLAAAGMGVLIFFSSLFGDLIESIMKRDAGMKDSGDLIPGHGGLLDRVDGYMFTGAVTYFYINFVLPNLL